ncbi:MAG: hypothetical protein K8S15_10125 [Candidatus Aegiribacteria sp.]|nr:hypothetical protein [Candidatus Aegiribacteria sp.]
MRGKTAVIIVSILLAVLTIPALAQSRSETDDIPTITITLTRIQFEAVKDAPYGESSAVYVTLTDEQINTISSSAWRLFDLEEEPLLMYPAFFCAFTDLREGNTVLLSINTYNCIDPDNPRLTIECISVVVIAP